MMNAAFIQATELDDYHAAAPVHNSAIMLPTFIAATESLARRSGHPIVKVSGAHFLLSTIVDFESSIRAGNGFYDNDMLA